MSRLYHDELTDTYSVVSDLGGEVVTMHITEAGRTYLADQGIDPSEEIPNAVLSTLWDRGELAPVDEVESAQEFAEADVARGAKVPPPEARLQPRPYAEAEQAQAIRDLGSSTRNAFGEHVEERPDPVVIDEPARSGGVNPLVWVAVLIVLAVMVWLVWQLV